MENIIEIENLNKSYKDVLAVNNVSFKVKKGQLFAFLGVNGAGKSTTINIICGSIKKDSGRVFVNGYDLDTQLFDIKSKIGVVFQNSVLDKSLTVLDNLRSRASLYKIYNDEFLKRVKELAEQIKQNESIITKRRENDEKMKEYEKIIGYGLFTKTDS